jgi:hypothetical protein
LKLLVGPDSLAIFPARLIQIDYGQDSDFTTKNIVETKNFYRSLEAGGEEWIRTIESIRCEEYAKKPMKRTILNSLDSPDSSH